MSRMNHKKNKEYSRTEMEKHAWKHAGLGGVCRLLLVSEVCVKSCIVVVYVCIAPVVLFSPQSANADATNLNYQLTDMKCIATNAPGDYRWQFRIDNLTPGSNADDAVVQFSFNTGNTSNHYFFGPLANYYTFGTITSTSNDVTLIPINSNGNIQPQDGGTSYLDGYFNSPYDTLVEKTNAVTFINQGTDQGEPGYSAVTLSGEVPGPTNGATAVTIYDSRSEIIINHEVKWATSSEADCVGYDVYRVVDGVRTKLNGSIIPSLGELGGEYSILDTNGQAAGLSYEIVDIDIYGNYYTNDLMYFGEEVRCPAITADGNFVLNWGSEPGREYRVKIYPDLVSDPVTNIVVVAVATNCYYFFEMDGVERAYFSVWEEEE